MGEPHAVLHGLGSLDVNDREDSAAQHHLSQSFGALQVNEQNGAAKRAHASLSLSRLALHDSSETLHQVSNSLSALQVREAQSRHATDSMDCADGSSRPSSYYNAALDGLLHSPRPGHPRSAKYIAVLDTNFLLSHLLWLCSVSTTEAEERVSLVVPFSVCEEIQTLASNF
eukprot:3758702-Rhodomonas_salina.1